MNVKTCTKCGETKPFGDFYNQKAGRNGLTPNCKQCTDERTRAWKKANPERMREKSMKRWRKDIEVSREKAKLNARKWRAANPERRLELERAARARNPERYRARVREYGHRIRHEMLAAYGNKCACCGETTTEFLSIDHIHGGGNKHRKAVSCGVGGNEFYRWLKKNGFPKDDFQLLCYNCNLAKGFYGECPHKREMSLHSTVNAA